MASGTDDTYNGASLNAIAARMAKDPDDLDLDVGLDELSKYDRTRVLALLTEGVEPSNDGLLDSIMILREVAEWLDIRGAKSRRIIPVDLATGTTSLVRIRAVRGDDLERIYSEVSDPAVANRWRYRGQIPSAEQFASTFGEDVLVQFIAEELVSKAPLSLNVLYGYDSFVNIAYFGVLGLGSTGSGVALRRVHGVVLAMAYGFTRWPLRKIYLEIPGYNENVIEGLPPDICRVEGRLKDFYFHDGVYWDKLIVGIERTAFFSALAEHFPPSMTA